MIQTFIHDPIKNMVENLNGKKNLKSILPTLESIVKAQGPLGEYELITALFEKIDWPEAIENNNPKDLTKIGFLTKRLKVLIFEYNFIDNFGIALSECANRSDVCTHLKNILKVLKITHPLDMIISMSFVLNPFDESQVKIGQYMLKKQLKEIFELGKPMPLPGNIIQVLADYIKTNDDLFKDIKEQVRFFFDFYVYGLKDIRYRTLFSVGEPQLSFPDISKEAVSIDYVKYLKGSMDLIELLKEIRGSSCENMGALKNLLKDFPAISDQEILSCILMMTMDNYKLQNPSDLSTALDSAKDQSPPASDFALLSYQYVAEGYSSVTNSKEAPKLSQKNTPKAWNIENFLKTMDDFYDHKINWENVLKCLILVESSELENFINEKKFVEQLFRIFSVIKKNFNVRLPQDWVNKKWANLRCQGFFLLSVLEINDPSMLFPGEILDKGKALSIENASGVLIGHIQDLEPIWSNKELVTKILELSMNKDIFQRAKFTFENQLKVNFEGVFYLLISIQPKQNQKLTRELLKMCVLFILNATNNLTDLVESFFKLNKNLFVSILAEICDSENNFIYLSKILDYSQTIKDFFLPLTQSDHHYFSISLAFLAVKREFLRLENWVEGRLTTVGSPWIEEFLLYIQRNLVDPLQQAQVINRRVIDENLEKAQLTMNGLAIIFENFLMSETNSLNINPRVKEKIKQFYEKIKKLLPEISQVCTNDTEKKSNEMLENLYFEKVTIEEFIDKVVKLKVSSSNRDQEILSCIIINIIDEFRFYQNFPEKELYITSEIFGRFIQNKIVDGRALAIFLKALNDSLEKEGKMFNFGSKALMHFVYNMDLNISPDFYKLLFANEKLRENHFQMLHQLQKKLAETDKLKFVQSEHIDIIEKKIHAQTLTKIKEPTEEEVVVKRKEKIVPEVKKVAEKSLMEILNKNFLELEKEEQLSDKVREKIVFWLNAFEDKKLEKRLQEFEELMGEVGNITWFSKYLVFKRVPSEPVVQNTYRKLIYRANVKNLYKTVYKYSMTMINIVIDFASQKEILLPEEKNTARFCGKWIGLITLVCNKPILLKNLDLKQRILESIDRKSVSNIIPIACALLTMMEKSTLFNAKVPFINALIDILREVLLIPWINHTTKIFIEVLFNEMKIKDKEIYRFNFIYNKKNTESDKNIFYINSLPNYVKIDTAGISELELGEKLHVDLRQIVAMAIDLAVKNIIKPVLDRSVKNTLETTRELALKDFAFEQDERKLFDGAKAMITNLTWNLALVTCREPLRVEITEHLDHLMSIQTDCEEPLRKSLKDGLANINLDLACSIVKKIVIENSIEEISKDKAINEEIELRRQAREQNRKYISEPYSKIIKDLPESLCPVENGNELDNIEIYTKFNQPNSLPERGYGISSVPFWGHETEPVVNPATTGTRLLEENKINELLAHFEKEIENPNSEEKMKAIHSFYSSFTKILQNSKNIEGQIIPLAEVILHKLFYFPFTMEKLRSFSDILVIYCNYNSKLPPHITKWIFALDDSKCFKPQIQSIFLRRSLLVLKDYDEIVANLLSEKNLNAINCIISVLKTLVIDEKTFSIYSFTKITEKFVYISTSDIMNSLNLENSIFIQNLVEFIQNENKLSTLKFRLTNIEPEYKRLFADLKEYFQKLDEPMFEIASNSFTAILSAQSEADFQAILKKDEEHHSEEKDFVTYFCYLFEIAVNKSLEAMNKGKAIQESFPLSCTYIDGLSRFITTLLRSFDRASLYLEKILTSFIMVLTKKHFYNKEQRFNQKPFHKILFNLIYDLHRPEYQFKDSLDTFSPMLMQTLHILQPIKYPGFAFAWLQLISSPKVINALLKDNNREIWNNYTTLIIDIMVFVRDIFTSEGPISEEMQFFYKGVLRLLLVLIHDFPDYLCEQSFVILEEIPNEFMQFRNIILSAYPKNLKIPNPFDISNQNYQNSSEYKAIPLINPKIEARINSHNLQTALINYIKNKDQNEFENIVNSFYIMGYKKDMQINLPLLESFIVYVPYFIYSSTLIRLPERTEPIRVQQLQGPELLHLYR
jgi:CCR4-NOT transcription complex subunit 1